MCLEGGKRAQIPGRVKTINIMQEIFWPVSRNSTGNRVRKQKKNML